MLIILKFEKRNKTKNNTFEVKKKNLNRIRTTNKQKFTKKYWKYSKSNMKNLYFFTIKKKKKILLKKKKKKKGRHCITNKCFPRKTLPPIHSLFNRANTKRNYNRKNPKHNLKCRLWTKPAIKFKTIPKHVRNPSPKRPRRHNNLRIE